LTIFVVRLEITLPPEAPLTPLEKQGTQRRKYLDHNREIIRHKGKDQRDRK
jgi:hypothetical protein